MSEVKTSMKRQNMIETYKRWVGRERGMGGEAEGGEICRHCYCLNLLADTSKRSQKLCFPSKLVVSDFIMVK